MQNSQNENGVSINDTNTSSNNDDEIMMKTEIAKCVMCNCETHPVCSVDGQVCKCCFDIVNFCHKRKNVEKPGHFKDKGFTPQQWQLSNDPPPPLIVEFPKLEIEYADGDGDCLYTSISNALYKCVSKHALRRLVADNQTRATFESYKNIYTKELVQIKTLRQFKNVLKQCGSDYGAFNCIWGDENALQIISNDYLINFCIFNEEFNLISTISPQTEEIANGMEYSKRFILLLLNNGKSGQEHYNLLKFDRKRILSERYWNYLYKLARGTEQK